MCPRVVIRGEFYLLGSSCVHKQRGGFSPLGFLTDQAFFPEGKDNLHLTVWYD